MIFICKNDLQGKRTLEQAAVGVLIGLPKPFLSTTDGRDEDAAAET